MKKIALFCLAVFAASPAFADDATPAAATTPAPAPAAATPAATSQATATSAKTASFNFDLQELQFLNLMLTTAGRASSGCDASDAGIVNCKAGLAARHILDDMNGQIAAKNKRPK